MGDLPGRGERSVGKRRHQLLLRADVYLEWLNRRRADVDPVDRRRGREDVVAHGGRRVGHQGRIGIRGSAATTTTGAGRADQARRAGVAALAAVIPTRAATAAAVGAERLRAAAHRRLSIRDLAASSTAAAIAALACGAVAGRPYPGHRRARAARSSVASGLRRVAVRISASRPARATGDHHARVRQIAADADVGRSASASAGARRLAAGSAGRGAVESAGPR